MNGWFADIDDNQPLEEFPWQPCLQSEGACFSFEVWFKTEEDCLSWIRENVLGKGMTE